MYDTPYYIRPYSLSRNKHDFYLPFKDCDLYILIVIIGINLRVSTQ
jgi:hypothetical protein